MFYFKIVVSWFVPFVTVWCIKLAITSSSQFGYMREYSFKFRTCTLFACYKQLVSLKSSYDMVINTANLCSSILLMWEWTYMPTLRFNLRQDFTCPYWITTLPLAQGKLVVNIDYVLKLTVLLPMYSCAIVRSLCATCFHLCLGRFCMFLICSCYLLQLWPR